MPTKLLSTILIAVYSITSPVIYPHQSASALRTPSAKCSSAGSSRDEIVRELTGQPESSTVTAACWEKFLVLKDDGFKSGNLWNQLALATETVDDVNFLNAVHKRFTKHLPSLVKQGVENSVQRAQGLLPAMRKAPAKPDRKTVNIVATEDGFALAGEAAPVSEAGLTFLDEAPAAAAFNIPAPDAAPETWQECIDSVRSKEELAAIKKAFKSCTLPAAEQRKVSFTLAAFWVDKGKNPKTHKDFEEAQPPAAPAKVKPAGISDDALAKVGVAVKDIKSRTPNKSGDKAIVTKTGDGQPQLFVVKANGELLTKGLLFGLDTGRKFFIFGADGKLSRLRLEDLQILTMMDSKVTTDTCDMFMSLDGNLFMLYIRGQDTVKVYQIDVVDFKQPYREFNNLGKPTKISFSSDSKLAIFQFTDGRADLAVDIEANQVVAVVPTAAPAITAVPTATAIAAAAEIRRQIKEKDRMASASDIRGWLESAAAIKPPDFKLFDDIQTVLDRNSTILEGGKEAFSREIEAAEEKASTETAEPDAVKDAAAEAAKAAGITLVSGKSGKEASGEIEIADDADASGSGSALINLGEDEDAAEAEKIKQLLLRVEEVFRKAGTTGDVDNVEAACLKKNAGTGYQEKVKAFAVARKGELEKLHGLSQHLDQAINEAVSIEKGGKHTQLWIDEVRTSLKAVIDTKSAALEKVKDKRKHFYAEAMALIRRKSGIFSGWVEIIDKATKVNTFSELDVLAERLKKKHEKRRPKCIETATPYITRRRAALGKRQQDNMPKLEAAAARALDEYMKLDKAVVAYDNAVEALKAAAEAKGTVLWWRKRFDNLTLAVEKTGRARAVAPLLSHKLEPVKKALPEAVRARAELVKAMKIYAIALNATSFEIKPESLALTKVEYDKKIAKMLSDLFQGRWEQLADPDKSSGLLDAGERFVSYKSPSRLEKVMRSRDARYFGPLCIFLKIEDFEPMPKDILEFPDDKLQAYVRLRSVPTAESAAMPVANVPAAIASQA